MRNAKLSLVLWSDNVSIYSPKLEGELETEFEKFLNKHRDIQVQQLKDDFNRIIAALDKVLVSGAKENLFRPEGKYSDGVCAVPLLAVHRRKDIGTLRLYCLRLDDNNMIVGNGAIKTTRTTQESPELQEIVNTLHNLDVAIKECIRKGILVVADNKIENIDSITISI